MKYAKGSLLALLTIGLPDGSAAQIYDANLVAEKMEAYFHDYLKPADEIMGTAAVCVRGEEIFNYQLGFSLEGIEADDQTQYRIGSISKTFTATMILQLVDQQLLSLDTLLADFYPELPNAGNITIQQMLQHQSGLKSFTDLQSYSTYFLAEQTKAQQLERFAGEDFSPEFPPGSHTQYSNTNYALLGFIVEDVSGVSFADYLEQNIVRPLNLSRTAIFEPASAVANIAISFKTPRWTAYTKQTHSSVPGGAGNLMSTASDLNAFYRGLLHTGNGTDSLLLSSSGLANMTSFTPEGFGLGAFLFEWDEEWVGIAHSGGIDQFSSLAVYFPKQDVSFAYIQNGIGEEEIERDPEEDIFSILTNPESFELPSTDLAAFADASTDAPFAATTSGATCFLHGLVLGVFVTVFVHLTLV